jgi:hypothetical protein
MTDPSAVPFVFPDISGRKVLILGLGGGCDIITAFALAKLLDRGQSESVVYANTKTGDVGSVEHITAHILRVSGPVIESRCRVRGRGKAWIDHSVPRSPNGSPWIVLLGDDVAERELVGELQSLDCDLVIGVDTGGDSIAHKRGRGHLGRDQRMLGVLRRTGLPLLHVVVAPGSDGEASCEDLRTVIEEHVADGRYRGCFALDPILPTLRAFLGSLGPTRTPQIILAAAEGRLAQTGNGHVVVPRGRKPAVPKHWLTTGFVFAPERQSTG